MFSAIKLGLIIFVLLKDSNPCIESLSLNFVLIGVCEGYELIFSCLVLIPPFLFRQNISQRTIYVGQLIYELFRAIFTFVMSYNFIEEDECTMNIRSGLLAIYLIISAFLGYFIFTIFIILYCCQQKIKNKENSEEIKSILNKYKTKIPIEEVCGICLDNEAGESVILSCGHGFHLKCIKGWLEIKKLCPMCRSEQGNFRENL